jgi:hypothetical protein
MATIVWDATGQRVHRPRRRPVRCGGAMAAPAAAAVARRRRVEARAAERCRGRSRRALATGVGVGVAVAGALALALVPGGDGPSPSAPAAPTAPTQPVSVSPSGADPEVGGTYRLIDRALAGSGDGDVSGLVAGLERAAGE